MMRGNSELGMAKHRAARAHCGRSKLYHAAVYANSTTDQRTRYRTTRRRLQAWTADVRTLFA